jgi:hypothetical protein
VFGAYTVHNAAVAVGCSMLEAYILLAAVVEHQLLVQSEMLREE